MIGSEGQSRLSRKRKAQEVKPFPSRSSSKRNPHETLHKQAAAIRDFIVEKLQGRASSSSGTSSNISPSAYLTLLPTIWTLINNSNLVVLADPPDPRQQGSNGNEVLQVTLDHAVKVSSKAASKRLTVEFVARLIMVRI